MTAEWLLQDKPKKQGFDVNKIYNKQTGTIFNRSPSSWGKLIGFYLTFYAVLVALAAMCMWVFYQTLDPRIPKRKLSESAIGENPGLAFRPVPEDVESTLIWLQGSNASQYMPWVNNLMDFLNVYYTPGSQENGNDPHIPCNYDTELREGQVCGVMVRDWGNCTYQRKFNFDLNRPCIFLKMNRIYGWVPQYYEPHDLPKEMPKKLKKHIQDISNTNPKMLKTVWISCEGENPADVEYLGELEYFPRDIQGFPGYYFPYTHAEAYLSPLVAISLKQPITGIVINIECKLWAKNIHHSRRDKSGLVHFELLLQ